MNKRVFLAALLLAALGLAGCGGSDDEPKESAPPESPLAAAYDKCAPDLDTSMKENFEEDAPEIDEVIRVKDDGKSLIITTPDPGGEIASGLAVIATNCVLEKTDAPATVSANMSATTALAGSQSANWDDIEVVWSYAAGATNAGFNATFAITD